MNNNNNKDTKRRLYPSVDSKDDGKAEEPARKKY